MTCIKSRTEIRGSFENTDVHRDDVLAIFQAVYYIVCPEVSRNGYKCAEEK
jgi:hypothetical protein